MDVAAPPACIIDIWEAVQNGAPAFSIGSDGKIALDAPQGFRVYLDVIQIGSGCVERIHVAEPFHEGSVASMSDLLRLRAVTVVDRGSDGEMDDFRWLLSEVAKAGLILPGLNQEELEVVTQAGVDLCERAPESREHGIGRKSKDALASVEDANARPAVSQTTRLNVNVYNQDGIKGDKVKETLFGPASNRIPWGSTTNLCPATQSPNLRL